MKESDKQNIKDRLIETMNDWIYDIDESYPIHELFPNYLDRYMAEAAFSVFMSSIETNEYLREEKYLKEDKNNGG